MQIETDPQIPKFKLLLTEKELRWLNAVMQNPLSGESPHDEDTEQREMRTDFFIATKLPYTSTQNKTDVSS
jgi:hypothetical protein